MLYIRIFFCALLIVCCAAASQPAPQLATLPPIALKSGQTIELTLAGKHLGAIQSAVLNTSGMTATLVEPAKEDHLRLKLTATPDAPIGERQLRLIGSAGVTSPLRVFVSAYDVQSLGVSDEPQPVQLPATVVGQIATAGQLQRMRFDGHKGELIVFDVSARRISSPLEAVITVESENGRQLQATLEHHAGDPLLLFSPPEDGRYVLSLRDLRYRGGPEYGFRITAGHIPYLESVLPGSGKPGTIVNAKPIGYNLDGAPPVKIDLTRAAPGRITVHATASSAVSNEVPFEVTDLPQFTESEPNDRVEEANRIDLPVEISGSTDKAADEDFFRFNIPYKQSISLEVLSARFGSPMVPLLQLRNGKGEVIEANDGTPDSDARIVHELDAGEYLASIRDLAYSGGPGHWYRLKIEPARSLQPDFSVSFQPNALRLHRGGNTAVWFDVRRLNGLHGDVSLVAESLPAGVTASSLILPENGSGWITLSASQDAALGTVPLRFASQAMAGTVSVTHESSAGGYLTVLDPAPFTIETTATLTPQQLDATNARLSALAAKLAAPNPHLESAQVTWEKQLPTTPIWKPVDVSEVSSAKGTKLQRLPDGSILAESNFADQDDYAVTARTDIKAVTAFRLEALADKRLPGSGPGTAPNGNFVLSEFKLSAAKGDEPSKLVELRNATSDFAQESFPASAAVDGKPDTGWAIDPKEGQTHTAIFRTASPVGSGLGTRLTFVLSHKSGFARHNLGRFRISVTTVDPSKFNSVAEVPPGILKLVATPADERTDQQRTQIAAYYRTIDPEVTAIRNQLAALRSFIGPYAELQRLQATASASTPAIDAEQKQWEQRVSMGDAWTILQPTAVSSDAGATPTREADGSVFADGSNATPEVLHVTAQTPLKSITAMRLELLPDPRLPANGPGRASDGSFELNHIDIACSGDKDASSRNVQIGRVRATAQQQESPISSLICDDPSRKWSAGPGAGLPVDATLYFDEPAATTGSTTFRIALHQPAQHGIGRFRLWVTSNPDPDAAQRLPDSIQAIIKTPDTSRSPGQKQRLSDYFRSTSPSLVAIRDRMTELRTQTPATPLRLRRNQPIAIPVLLNRADGFRDDVNITLEGYAPGNPKMVARQIKVTPLMLKERALYGLLTIQPEAAAEMATRNVVLKAESKQGDEVITQYSTAFPITIQSN